MLLNLTLGLILHNQRKLNLLELNLLTFNFVLIPPAFASSWLSRTGSNCEVGQRNVKVRGEAELLVGHG